MKAFKSNTLFKNHASTMEWILVVLAIVVISVGTLRQPNSETNPLVPQLSDVTGD